MNPAQIKALQENTQRQHPGARVQLLETHISWILLTGDLAYKIKKPVDFGFLDFSSLDKRRHYCEEEIRLNRRLAPDIYQDVVPVTGPPESPSLAGSGKALDYAVRMRQFDPQQRLDRLFERGELTPEHLDSLADTIGAFHLGLPASRERGAPEAVVAPMRENFQQIQPHLDSEDDRRALSRIREATEACYQRLHGLLDQRRELGHIRECHGDLHLGNITCHQGRVRIFDCIEFNPDLRWIDTCNDLAFLLMDLELRDAGGWAQRLLNRYLHLTGDFDSLPLLSFYKTYRAMVRAKVALLTARSAEDPSEASAQQSLFGQYLAQALRYGEKRRPFLLITTGLSGSGKSWASARLAEALGLVWLRSDIERKRLFGLRPLDSSRDHPDLDIYTPEVTRQTYDRLARLAGQAMEAGYPVIIDSAALNRRERAQLADVAGERGLSHAFIACQAPEDVLARRLETRQQLGGDPSEADQDIMRRQKDFAEPLSPAEAARAWELDTRETGSLDRLSARLEKHFPL